MHSKGNWQKVQSWGWRRTTSSLKCTHYGTEKICISVNTTTTTTTIIEFRYCCYFPFTRKKFELSEEKGDKNMVRDNECSSYRGFELTSVFYKKVLGKVQGECKIVRVNESSSYRGFELSGLYCIRVEN